MAAQPLKNQRGFGIIEAVVAMSLLSIATLAIMKWFSSNRNSELKTGISMKNLQAQRSLELAIWATYDKHTDDQPSCNIRMSNAGASTEMKYIGLSNNGACTNATDSDKSLKAEITTLTDFCSGLSSPAEQIAYDQGSRTISFTTCPPYGARVTKINKLTNKQDFRIIFLDQSTPPNTYICSLDNSESAASGNATNLTLKINCPIQPATGNYYFQLPKYSIKFLGNGGSFDGYHRFYY